MSGILGCYFVVWFVHFVLGVQFNSFGGQAIYAATNVDTKETGPNNVVNIPESAQNNKKKQKQAEEDVDNSKMRSSARDTVTIIGGHKNVQHWNSIGLASWCVCAICEYTVYTYAGWWSWLCPSIRPTDRSKTDHI